MLQWVYIIKTISLQHFDACLIQFSALLFSSLFLFSKRVLLSCSQTANNEERLQNRLNFKRSKCWQFLFYILHMYKYLKLKQESYFWQSAHILGIGRQNQRGRRSF